MQNTRTIFVQTCVEKRLLSSMAFFSFFPQQKARQKAVPTNTTKNISADKQTADTFLAMPMVLVHSC